MKEIWKEIEELEGYFVSNLGRVRGKNGGIIKFRHNKNLYYIFRRKIENKEREFIVHRLVAIAFI